MIINKINFLATNYLKFKHIAFLYALFVKNRELVDILNKTDPINNEDLFYLSDNDFIDIPISGNGDIYFSKITLKENGKNIIKEYEDLDKPANIVEQDSSFDTFLDSYFNLWPSGIKSGGYYVKTDKNGCGKNLKKFLKNNPEITKEIILKATEKYLMDMKERNYSMCKLAPYFVYKDGLSALEGYCSNMNKDPFNEDPDPFTVKV